MSTEKIAVVGAGISGLSAAWLLAKKYEVHLFEAESRLGGHAHTTLIDSPSGPLPLDTGFLVYNELTYPNLVAFFKELGVETVDSDMSLSVQNLSKGLEWCGTNLNTVFGQRSNLFRPRFYKMLLEILRFAREADMNLSLAREHNWTLAELLNKRNYSTEFVTDYLMPIGAAIWSTPEGKMTAFPAETFLTFFINHKLLQVTGRPTWRTVKNGSHQYVQKVAKHLPHIHVSSPVLEAERVNGQVFLRTPGEILKFDRVVFATHAPVTAKVLKGQSTEENRILSSIAFETNLAILHKDPQPMPSRRQLWASWNAIGDQDRVSLSYYLNKLQPWVRDDHYFVTLNPIHPIKNPILEILYGHPQFDHAAIRAQRDLPGIQGHGGIYYAGAWSRFGFHEDGLLSSIRVAELLGVNPAWKQT